MKLNNILLCNPWIKKEIQWETREYFELNENENAYIILEWKRIITLKTYIRKKKRSQINDHSLHLKKLEKEDQI